MFLHHERKVLDAQTRTFRQYFQDSHWTYDSYDHRTNTCTLTTIRFEKSISVAQHVKPWYIAACSRTTPECTKQNPPGIFCHLVVFYPLREPRYNPFKGTFEDVDLFFPRWDRLVSWRGNIFFVFGGNLFFPLHPRKLTYEPTKISVSTKRNPHFPRVLI